MNTKIFMFAACAAVLGLSSCSKDDEVKNETKGEKIEMTFGVGSAATEQSQTRAYVDTESMDDSEHQNADVDWATDDQLKIFNTTDVNGNIFNFVKYVYNGENATKHSAYFKGYTTKSDRYFVMYPVQDNAKYLGTGENVYKFNAEIPATQKATYNSFDPKAMIQFGVSSGSSELNMNHICSFLYITTADDHVSTITITGDKDIAGTIQLNQPETGSCYIKSITSGSKTINLQNVGAAGTYMIGIIPVTAVKLSVTVTYDDNSTKTQTYNALDASPAYTYSLGTTPKLN